MPTRAELKLDLNALAASSESASLDAESEQAAPSAERHRTLARSPRMRRNLLDDGAEPELPPTTKEGAPSDRQQTLVRSPRVRKNLLDDSAEPERPTTREDAPSDQRQPLVRSPRVRKNLLEGESEAAASPTPQAKPSLKKGGGLKALKDSDSKPALVSTSATKAGESHPVSGEDTTKSSKLEKKKGDNQRSKDASVKSKKKAGKVEAKALDQHDENEQKSDSEPQHDRTGELKQPVKSTLSPLRRRKPATESVEPSLLGGKLVGHRLKLRDLPPANQPEVHVIGEITSGEGFGSGGFACKWGVELGGSWHHIAGDQLGQTQIDYPSSDRRIIWSHPIDLHFATSSFHGWPKLLLQVWHIDAHMKANVVGYGFVNLPFASGEHELTAALWRPMGSAKEELAATLLGRTPELVSDDVVFSAAWADRCRLQTVATGKVQLHVAIILRNFQVSRLQM